MNLPRFDEYVLRWEVLKLVIWGKKTALGKKFQDFKEFKTHLKLSESDGLAWVTAVYSQQL